MRALVRRETCARSNRPRLSVVKDSNEAAQVDFSQSTDQGDWRLHSMHGVEAGGKGLQDTIFSPNATNRNLSVQDLN